MHGRMQKNKHMQGNDLVLKLMEGRGLDSSQGLSRLHIYPPRGAHIRIREGLRAPLAGMLHHFQHLDTLTSYSLFTDLT